MCKNWPQCKKLRPSRMQWWGAILLIDEADVYIHERGKDISQNAVVGVFLRVLEYYKGILFMTSNRNEVIDDAIKSRATAEIEYCLPDLDGKKKIWSILLDQFNLQVQGSRESFLESVTEMFPEVSGRDIKALLKLAGLLAKKKETKIDINLLKFVSKFKTINHTSK